MQYCNRWIEGPLGRPGSARKVRLVFGARQTGKSTLLRHVAGAAGLWIDLQDSSRRIEFERRPRAFSEFVLAGPRRATVVVDEIQKVPALLDEIQWLNDRHPGRFRFALTGSSARRLRAHSANLLPGRSHLFHLFPVLQAERMVKSRVLPMPAHHPAAPFPPQNLADLLLHGSLPGVLQESREGRKRTLEAYSELYLEEEIRREGLVRDVGAFSRFLELAAIESGRTMNLVGVSKESGVPIATLRLFYQVLVDTFVGYWLPPYAGRDRSRLLKTPRFYFFDLGVRNSTARLPLSADLIKLQGGHLLEHWVGLELYHRCRLLGRGYRLGFWRTVGGAEVDFVVETPREILPIEVKWTDKPAPSDVRHLEHFMGLHPARSRRAFLVCRVAEPRRLTERITAIPWSEL